MKISFGIIVFNGLRYLPEGLLKACIDNVYDFAHEIFIVEGAVNDFKGKISSNYNNLFSKLANKIKNEGITEENKKIVWAAKIDMAGSGFASWAATEDGHSLDGTLEFLQNYRDPKNKIQIITNDTFWPDKTVMCNAWASKATGDYIWQLDSDEFYKLDDLIKINKILDDLNNIDAVYFTAYNFVDSFYTIRKNNDDNKWMRLFRHKKGYSYWESHEPPIYITDGECMNIGNVMDHHKTKEMQIYMYHYTNVITKQKLFKELFFQLPRNNIPVVPFEGSHPEIIKKLLQ